MVEERKKRLEGRRKQRKEERRNTYYRQKEEEAQRIREEQLKKGNTTFLHVCGGTEVEDMDLSGACFLPLQRYLTLLDLK